MVAARTKLKRNYSDTEFKSGGYDGPAPKPGLYPAKLIEVEPHTTSPTAVHWTFEITEGTFKGWRGHVYTNAEAVKWKEQQILVAAGLMQPNGSVDLSFEQMPKKAKVLRVRVINEEYQEEIKGKITSIIAAADEAVDRDADVEEDDDEEFAKPTASRAAARRKKAAEPEPEDEDEDEEEDEEDADDGVDLDALEEELSGLDLKALKALARKDYGLTLAQLKNLDEDGVTDLILEAAEGADAEEEEPEDDEEEGDDTDDEDTDDDEEEEEEEPEPEPEPVKPARRARRTAAAKAEPAAKPAARKTRTTRKPPF